MSHPHIERFGPDVSTDKLIEAVDRDGCAIVHEGIPPEQLSRLNSEFAPLIEATPPGTPNHIPMLVDFMGWKTIRIDGLPGKSKTFVEVLQNPRTLAFADHYLLPSCLHYLLSTAQLIEILPGETVQALHRDDPAWIHPPIQIAATHRDKADTRGNASDNETQLEVVVLYALCDFTADSGNKVRRHFCGTCGSQIASEPVSLGEIMVIKAGGLDDSSWVKPGASIYVDSAPSWAVIPEDLPKFPKMPPMG